MVTRSSPNFSPGEAGIGVGRSPTELTWYRTRVYLSLIMVAGNSITRPPLTICHLDYITHINNITPGRTGVQGAEPPPAREAGRVAPA
jgi:hypothetical protein